MQKPLLILKLGTSSITHSDGHVNDALLNSIAAQCKGLQQDYRLLIVSSGAVGLGRKRIVSYSGKLSERKAAAAIGNPLLMQHYATAFGAVGIQTAQTLCERSHFSNRTHFLQLRQTVDTLWQNDIIPIANENDVVSDHELKFSDNDELATLMAVGFGAEVLLIGTSVDGVMDKQGQVIPEIRTFTNDIMSLATRVRSEFGLGGMISKLTFARLASRLGIRVVIFSSETVDGIQRALNGQVGTTCFPKSSSPDARKKWLASGSIVSGRITIDAGAGKALNNRKSLLSVGVTSVDSSFERGEVIEIYVEDIHWPLGVGRARLSSEELVKQMAKADQLVAHADDIVLL